MTKIVYYSNGKLLLSGEYAVLDGALALALPTKFGQHLEVEENATGILHWNSFDADGSSWFRATFTLPDLTLVSSSDLETAARLLQILNATQHIDSTFLKHSPGISVKTQLTFPRNWGLGSSSTLINNMAQWSGVNPYMLLKASFGGSGYDIACASHNYPLFYQLKSGKPVVEATSFAPSFKEQLYFVFLNEKQNSRTAIQGYKNLRFDKNKLIAEISEMTRDFVLISSLQEFHALIDRHEQLLASVLGLQPVKQRLFPDYSGAIKSLGAWGGDFILATGDSKTPDYFTARGFSTIVPYDKMIL